MTFTWWREDRRGAPISCWLLGRDKCTDMIAGQLIADRGRWAAGGESAPTLSVPTALLGTHLHTNYRPPLHPSLQSSQASLALGRSSISLSIANFRKSFLWYLKKCNLNELTAVIMKCLLKIWKMKCRWYLHSCRPYVYYDETLV